MKEKPYILVVDDDPNIAKLEQLYLEKAGYEVKTVGRGDDAMTEFRKMPPDLMLLDVMMPGMDGWQVLKAVRKSSNIPIIMGTARDETVDKVQGLELGEERFRQMGHMLAVTAGSLQLGAARQQMLQQGLAGQGLSLIHI